MKKDDALKLLREHFIETQRQFGVKRLALFGSTVRDEAREDYSGPHKQDSQLRYDLTDRRGTNETQTI